MKFIAYKPRASLCVYGIKDGNDYLLLPPGVRPEQYAPAVDNLERVPATEFDKLFTAKRKKRK
jgi:hypothetical protein